LKTNLAKKEGISAIEQLSAMVVESMLEKKAEEVISMDLSHLDDAITDRIIICEANSTRQVQAIADNILLNVKKELLDLPSHVEGMNNGEWILIDYFNLIVHVFLREKRAFYQIEDLWSDALTVEHEG